MALPKFDYLAPKSIGEACAALAANPDGGKLIAGGVSLLRVMKFRIMSPDCLIDVKSIPGLRYVKCDKDVLKIGATATSTDVLRSSDVAEKLPLLSQAIARIATTAVRNWATVVGNICVGHTASDPSAALLALGAELVISNPKGERTLPIDQFFLGHMSTALEEAELVREIRIPLPKEPVGMAYLAHAGRAAMETPLIAVGVALTANGKGCTSASISLAGSAETPIRLTRAEKALVGAKLDEKAIHNAALIAAEDCAPDSDVYASAEYRRRLVAVYVRDALQAAAGRIGHA
ncbi:xanthine dehydrogenase family protein subunit M [Tardiphaga sp.]|uniref:FAD binding domain-containing protein n=1 Tax=Tardiphaga sp. TaxID=1926292 RepID=UPI003529DB0A